MQLIVSLYIDEQLVLPIIINIYFSPLFIKQYLVVGMRIIYFMIMDICMVNDNIKTLHLAVLMGSIEFLEKQLHSLA